VLLAQSGTAMPKVTALFIICFLIDLRTARRHPKPVCTPPMAARQGSQVAQWNGVANDYWSQHYNETNDKIL
jgi:hypothetical protein